MGSHAQPAVTLGQITGVVTAGGSPLGGAQVRVGTTPIGAATGDDGPYRIANVRAGTYTLNVVRIGFEAQSQTVIVSAGGTATANVQMTPQAVQLEAVVAIGYGTTHRSDLAGAVASVSGGDVVARGAPTSAISNALVGKAPGVQVVQSSGVPGTGASVRIRGTNSITAISERLYVIDGLPTVQERPRLASESAEHHRPESIWKYRPTSYNSARSDVELPIYRYAETLLDYAEAQNELGNTATAIAAVNQVRARACRGTGSETRTEPADLPTTLTKGQARDAIYLERNWELAFEQKRWFDLVRRDGEEPGWFAAKLTAPDPHAVQRGPITTTKKLFPAPQTEIDAMPTLTQNPGY